MRSSHNTSSIRLKDCLHAAGVHAPDLIAFLTTALECPPRHKTAKQAIEHKLLSVQAERLILLISA